MIDEQSKLFYKNEYFVRYSEMDYKKALKPSALFNFLQDVATNAADKAYFGYNEVSSRHLAWYLLKYHMEFSKYPVDVKNLFIKTEARGYNKLFAHRDFEIYNENKELLGRVLSYWSLVDVENKSMIAPQTVFSEFSKVEKREDDMSFNKVKEPEAVDYSEVFKIRYDDIDVNQHVNNANYIVWAFEALPKEFRDSHRIKTLDMIYKKEIQYGNSIVSEAQLSGDTAKIVVKNKETQDELCAVNIEFVAV
ncbi:MAG: acyl-[acyl-carrier-protein] thioesterase [Candidatus Gastranaerophilaceae bacterium]